MVYLTRCLIRSIWFFLMNNWRSDLNYSHTNIMVLEFIITWINWYAFIWLVDGKMIFQNIINVGIIYECKAFFLIKWIEGTTLLENVMSCEKHSVPIFLIQPNLKTKSLYICNNKATLVWGEVSLTHLICGWWLFNCLFSWIVVTFFGVSQTYW